MQREILENLNLATMSKSAQAYGLINDGAIALNGTKIDWCGARNNLPKVYRDWPHCNLNGRLVTPALIDCHTHIVYGGNRAKEFEMRLEGATYEEILSLGGGIHSTVSNTRNLTEDELVACAIPRIDALIAEGVSTIEIKSGYGLGQQNRTHYATCRSKNRETTTGKNSDELSRCPRGSSGVW